MSLFDVKANIKVYVNHADGRYWYRDCSSIGYAVKKVEEDTYHDLCKQATAEMICKHLAGSSENTYLWFRCSLDLHEEEYNIEKLISCNGDKTYLDSKKSDRYFGKMRRSHAKKIAGVDKI